MFQRLLQKSHRVAFPIRILPTHGCTGLENILAMKLATLLLLIAFSLAACSNSDDESIAQGTGDLGSSGESDIQSDSENLNDPNDSSDSNDPSDSSDSNDPSDSSDSNDPSDSSDSNDPSDSSDSNDDSE